MSLSPLILNIAVIAAALFAAARLRMLGRTIAALLAAPYIVFFYENWQSCSNAVNESIAPSCLGLALFMPVSLLVGSIERIAPVAAVIVAVWTLIEWLLRQRRM